MRDLMIDLETLGTKPGSPVIAIGAVMFDRTNGKLGEEFYGKIDVVDALNWARMNGDTFKWWMQQSNAAREEAVSGFLSSTEVFRDFINFINVNANLSTLRAWGNGSHFDITIIEVALHRVLSREAPWKFWNVRDVRTIKDVGECAGHKYPHELKGTAHNALHDSKHQARYVSYYFQALMGEKPKIDMGRESDVVDDFDGASDFDGFDDEMSPEDTFGKEESSALDDLLG